ncbi:hypothetical protein FRC09_007738 [Ceratobasidium sp. 395]|nr:hypothetical protein FRC09_007738 [Ceratobasidium sp. 395]
MAGKGHNRLAEDNKAGAIVLVERGENADVMLHILSLVAANGSSHHATPCHVTRVATRCDLRRAPREVAADAKSDGSNYVHGLHLVGPYTYSQTFANLAPRHTTLALQSNGVVNSVPASPTNSHQRVLSWMQRQGLSPVQANGSFPPAMAPLAGPTPRQDWVFGSPQMATAPLYALPAWDRAVPPPQVQPQP